MRVFLIFFVCILVFGISVFGGFVQDDRRIILADTSLGRWENLVNDWVSPYYKNDPGSGAYRPLTSISISLDTLIFGKVAWGYRLMNVLYYSLVVIGVYRLMLLISKNERYSFWTALVFTVLPIHSEAVSNIVGRGEILSGGLVILMIILAMEKRWEGSVLVYILALLAKESAILWVVPLIYLIHISQERKDLKVGVVMTLMIGLIGYFVLRWGVLGAGIFADQATMVENPLKFVSWWQRVMAGIGTVAFGVGKTLFPIRLSYDYSYNQLEVGSLTSLWFGLGVIIIGASVFLMRIKDRVIAWGWLFFWLPLLVTGNILKPIGTIFGERLWFLPSLGVVMILVWTVKKIKRWWVGVFLAILVVVFGVRTIVRNIDWLGEDRLFIVDGKYALGSVLAQSNAAAMYIKQNKLDLAFEYLEKAEAIYPTYPELMNNWGVYYWRKGDVKSAREKFEECLDTHQDNALCRSNLDDLKESIR